MAAAIGNLSLPLPPSPLSRSLAHVHSLPPPPFPPHVPFSNYRTHSLTRSHLYLSLFLSLRVSLIPFPLLSLITALLAPSLAPSLACSLPRSLAQRDAGTAGRGGAGCASRRDARAGDEGLRGGRGSRGRGRGPVRRPGVGSLRHACGMPAPCETADSGTPGASGDPCHRGPAPAPSPLEACGLRCDGATRPDDSDGAGGPKAGWLGRGGSDGGQLEGNVRGCESGGGRRQGRTAAMRCDAHP